MFPPIHVSLTCFTDIYRPEFRHARRVHPDPASEKSLNIAKAWLKDCLSSRGIASHHQCPSMATVQLPSRLIDVGEDSTSKLHVSRQGEEGNYLALSYCWGIGASTYVLTTSNIIAMQNEIVWESLPRTIQDAIYLTRKFGYRFLWVDAVCILQDSPEDWQIESSRMRSIYSQAIVTIAAAASPTASGGVLSLRPEIPGATLRFHDTMSPRSGTQPEWEPRALGDFGAFGYIYVQRHRPSFYDENQPLHFRAWTLQECLLSQRIISYNSHQMTWECPSGIASERDASATSRACSTYMLSDYQSESKGTPLFETNVKPEHKDWSPDRRWCTIVEQYSKRAMTKASDKLPALSGVVDRFQTFRLGDTYIAGLWQSMLPASMLWMVSAAFKQRRHKTYLAPSWSWACMSAAIQHDILFQKASGYIRVLVYRYAEVVSVDVQQSSMDRFGAIDSALIQMRAQLVEVRLISDWSTRWFPSIQTPQDPYYTGVGLAFSSDSIGDVHDVVADCFLDDYDEALRLRSGSWLPKLRYLIISRVSGLLVTRTENDGHWRRLGFARLPLDAHGGASISVPNAEDVKSEVICLI
jgi:hypothetical protein